MSGGPAAQRIALTGYPARTDQDLGRRAEAFLETMSTRRSVREFNDRPVPRQVIETCIRAAATAPSGANMQPWHFAAVADRDTKRRIRAAAEAEEKAFYAGRAGAEWLAALSPLGTDADKPYLELAPWLIVVFQQSSGRDPQGDRVKHYYVQESVGIAMGLLIAGLHHAGLATLVHTPSPMGFLRDILGRPMNERAVAIVVAGHPADGVTVPAITRKPLSDVASFR